MPWCPKCNLEYRDDITICSDCGTTLIEEIEDSSEFHSIAEVMDEETATKLMEFLQYEGIEEVTCEYVEVSSSWLIKVKDEAYKRAEKLFLAFRKSETDDADQTPNTNEEKSTEPATLAYVKKEDEYKDLISTVFTFVVIGSFGLLFLILNVTGFFSIISDQPLMLSIMGLIFVGFIIIGIASYKKALSVKKEIKTENELTDKINSWLKETITLDLLNEINEEEVSPEINYFKKTERIKELIKGQFEVSNDSFLEHVVEEFYNKEIDHI